jgi:catechol 2,3-dioxygenase-like lactoylglutathione lyase family enzyme
MADGLRKDAMTNHGYNHIGLATRDMDATKQFYEDVLGFITVRYDRFDIAEGGRMRHLFLDTGQGQLLSFLEPTDVSSIPQFDPGINNGLGVPAGFYHVAFEGGSVENLEVIRADLAGKGVKISPVVDHDWARSIYFFDPVNGLSLEFCAIAREFNDDDRTYQYRFTAPVAVLDVDIDALAAGEKSQMDTLAAR